MFGLTAKQIIRYSVLPDIRQRLGHLIGEGFQYVAFFMALVYQSVGLLPPQHPYTMAANIGRFGIRHVIAEAANNLVFSRKNIDKIITFFVMLFGIVLLGVQCILFFLSLFIQPVMAVTMPDSYADFFFLPSDAQNQQDLAHIFLDMVFGVPGIFNSCVSAGVACNDVINGASTSAFNDTLNLLGGGNYPFPVHVGLHQMFQLFSIGMLVIATMITLYFIATILAETAQTGTAFGRRFNKVWAPIRIVVAFGLLIPISYGLNSGQYIVLYAAKYGSAFATNGWNIFMGDPSAGAPTAGGGADSRPVGLLMAGNKKLVAAPNTPYIGSLLQFFFVARTCAELHQLGPAQQEIKMYLVRHSADPKNLLVASSGSVSYEDMLGFINNDTPVYTATQATVRFGPEPDPVKAHDELGYVQPTCGEITLPLADPRNPDSADNPPEPGTEVMQRYYWFIMQELWHEVFSSANSPSGENYPRNYAERGLDINPDAVLPTSACRAELQQWYNADLQEIMTGSAPSSPTPSECEGGAILPPDLDGIDSATEQQNAASQWEMRQSLLQKGWAAAGLWYNRIAQINGSLTTAAMNIPNPLRFPDIMMDVLEAKKAQTQNITMSSRFDPLAGNDEDQRLEVPGPAWRQDYALTLNKAFQYWEEDGTVGGINLSGNAFYDVINGFLGTSGLFSIRDNPDVHPMAQLVTVGRALIESAIRNVVGSGAVSIGGALFSLADQSAGEMASVIINFTLSITAIGLVAGFILFYVIPFLPFIYFFFAVGGWVKGILEAMIGVPLWALAHIRIDGDGLPGSAATNGYFLIFEIFLRPILIVFGLLASVAIFGAMASVLNEIWDLVTSNVAGFDKEKDLSSFSEYLRGPLDAFFYTILYTIVLYLIGMSCFKLIDQIPNNISRWMGQSLKTFNDGRADPAQDLVSRSTIAAQQATQSISGGFKQGLMQVSQIGGSLKK